MAGLDNSDGLAIRDNEAVLPAPLLTQHAPEVVGVRTGRSAATNRGRVVPAHRHGVVCKAAVVRNINTHVQIARTKHISSLRSLA